MSMITPMCHVEQSGEALPESQNPHEIKMTMVARGAYIPKEKPGRPQGEDAFFILEDQQTIGVADGVGGWFSIGIDSGVYARELMANAAVATASEPKGFVDLKKVLNYAFMNSKSDGSSTALIATLKNKTLHGINVGDCKLMVFRRNEKFYESPTMQHKFNKPYQLGNHEKCDKPESAEEYEVNVESGDIVILGSDGLWDNVHHADITNTLWQMSLGILDIQQLATYLAKFALNRSKQEYIITPFSIAAKEAGFDYLGGKIDDITVVVALLF